MIVELYKINFKEINTKIKSTYYQDNLIKAKRLETKYVLTDEKNYKDFTIYFTKYCYGKSIKMFSLHYHSVDIYFIV